MTGSASASPGNTTLPVDCSILSNPCSKTFFSLASTFKKPVCLSNRSPPTIDCSGPDPPSKSYDFWHRRRCHELCHANLTSLCSREGRPVPALGKCRTGKYETHCECFGGPALHQSLRTWVPKERKFCGTCKKFTFRRGKNKARCKPPLLP